MRRTTTYASTYAPSGFFLLRSPLLPLEVSASLAQSAGDAEGERYEEADALIDRLVARPEVVEALHLASPAFAQVVSTWRAETGARDPKVRLALVRYLLRMSSRATPFGLFAGISTGEVGGKTALEPVLLPQLERHVRLDMHVYGALAEALSARDDARPCLRYLPAPSLHRLGGKLRYAVLPLSGNGEDAFPSVEVEPHAALDVVLSLAAEGSTLGALASAVNERYPTVSLRDAAAFVTNAIQSGILVSELVPAVTGPEPAAAVEHALGAHAQLAEFHRALVSVHEAVDALAAAPLGLPTEAYSRIESGLRMLPIEVDPARLLQVDLVKPLAAGRLGARVTDELLRTVQLLDDLQPSQRPPSLVRFREHLIERYDGNAVALLEALDDDIGVGFDSPASADHLPLLEGLAIAPAAARNAAGWTPYDQFLLRRLLAATRSKDDVIEIAAGDYVAAKRESLPPVDAFVALFQLVAESGADVDAGRFTVVEPSFQSPSGIATLARFGHADPALTERLRAHTAVEDRLIDETGVLADVVHLPSGPVGNIVLRPRLRPYEIRCHGRSGAPVDCQIGADDLVVTVAGDRVVLTSKRLGKRIHPRLTNAHNALGDPTATLYRFLYALQFQDGTTASRWSWGALAETEYLPRVQAGKTILASARWTFGAAKLRRVVDAPPTRRRVEMRALRESVRMPARIAIQDDDHVLPLDLEDTLCIDQFVHLATNRKRVRCVEYAFTSGHSPVQNAEGAFANELAVPFSRRTTTETRALVHRVSAASAGRDFEPRDTFIPGSRVLYAKLYVAPSGIDTVLLEAVKPVVDRAIESEICTCWFFLRYAKPQRHLRLRLFGDPDRLWGEVLPSLHAAVEPLRRSGAVQRLELDSYERESARYGGREGTELAERIFCVDSRSCIDLLGLLQPEEGEDDRWQVAALGLDALLGDFDYDLPARVAFMQRSATSFAAEFPESKEFHHALGRKVRADRGQVEGLLRGEGSSVLAAARSILRARSHALKPIVEAWRDAHARGMIHREKNELVWSYLHMHTNRMLVTSARAQEMVLHHLLASAYRALLERERNPSR